MVVTKIRQVLALALAVTRRIKTPGDIEAYLGIPFLGLLPVVPPKEQFDEAMRAVRDAVVLSAANGGARSVMVTSTAPSEGKTVVSTNLGEALAQAEQRTLVVDGDMRRPRVHGVFEVEQEPGLSSVLVGAVDIRTAIRPTGNPYLFILPAGHIPPDPAELLGSARYRKLLADLGKEFDWIIVDAPPVMAVTDAAVVANGVGGVLFVVGAEMTTRRKAQTALEQLAAARAKVIGAVLNEMR